MTDKMFGKRLALGLVALLFAAMAWAWIDGGKQPLRDMAEPVAVPGGAR